jgi:phosphate starvation-inducible membrane PsiE
MKAITYITITTAILLMAVESDSTGGTLVIGLAIVSLLGIGAYTSNKVQI